MLPLAQNPRWTREARWAYVAQEIARDVFELPYILRSAGVTDEEWEEMVCSPGWQASLQEQVALWRSSLNARERIEAKQLHMIENALPEMYRAMHDPEFAHNAKVEIFKALARNVGIGIKDAPAQGVATGERISITINMGDDKKVEVQDVTPKVIEGEAREVEFQINE